MTEIGSQLTEIFQKGGRQRRYFAVTDRTGEELVLVSNG